MKPLAVIVLTLAVAAAGVPAELIAGPKIGVLNKGRGIVWEKTEEGYREAAAELGAELVLKVPPSATAVGAQLKLLEVLAKEKLDALVIAPTDPERLAEPVKAFSARGVKVVVVDTALPDGVGLTFVSHDQKAMAEAAAAAAVSLVRDGDEIAILRFTQTDRAMVEREAHLLRSLKSLRPGAKIVADVYASSGESGIGGQARTLLQKHPTARIVITTSFGATKAMVRLVQERELIGKLHVVGFGAYLSPDMAKAIEEGTLHTWIAQKPKDLGILSVKAAVALSKGEAVPPMIHSEFLVVSKSNLHNPAVQALLKDALPDPAAKPVEPAAP